MTVATSSVARMLQLLRDSRLLEAAQLDTLKRDWATLGPKLRGKIHIYVGSADTYFLNDAVYYIEDFLKSTKNPPYEGEVKYGDRAEHCWNGDPSLPNALSRLHFA